MRDWKGTVEGLPMFLLSNDGKALQYVFPNEHKYVFLALIWMRLLGTPEGLNRYCRGS